MQAITHAMRTENRVVLRIAFERDGHSEEELVTAEHPHWVVGRGWVPAGELHFGQQVATRSGGAVTVVALSADSVQTVYNLEIAQDHSYFVTGSGLWVHNPCIWREHPGISRPNGLRQLLFFEVEDGKIVRAHRSLTSEAHNEFAERILGARGGYNRYGGTIDGNTAFVGPSSLNAGGPPQSLFGELQSVLSEAGLWNKGTRLGGRNPDGSAWTYSVR